jgi:two-component system, NtrC family, response regulator HydG
MAKILLVDDEAAQREMLAGFLKKKGYQIQTAAGGVAAVSDYAAFFSPLAVIDLKMPDMNGLELLVRLREINPFIQVIVLTAFGTVETAVEAMRKGAYGYLTKPVNLDELLINLKKAADQNHLITENDLLRRTVADLAEIPEMIGDSEAMLKVRSLIARVGPSDSSVLLTGPSGSGKGLVAQSIHQLSPRRENRFVQLNCASLPETLLESELFGHEKGAFTGADRKRAGRFELADGGTIFLDEIGDMSLAMQAKLLRVLEEGDFEPLGSEHSKRVNVRVISATNRDLKKMIEEGRFREDLFFRIDALRIELPPLSARGGDVLILARHFLELTARKMNKTIKGITEDAAARLVGYHWPGNVRELRNVIERAVVLSVDTIIGPDDLPGLTATPAVTLLPVEMVSLAEMEKRHIAAVLKAVGGNMQRTSEVLGIHRNTLRQKIRDYGLQSAE